VLARNTHVKRAVLSNLQLVDSVASVLAGVLRVNTTLTSLNVENNILNEASLCEIAHALASNSTLLELKIAHQKKQIPTAVEEALANALEKNTTLLKLGFEPRQTQPRELIQKALARNADIMRKSLIRQPELDLLLDAGDWQAATELAETEREKNQVVERRLLVHGPVPPESALTKCLRSFTGSQEGVKQVPTARGRTAVPDHVQLTAGDTQQAALPSRAQPVTPSPTNGTNGTPLGAPGSPINKPKVAGAPLSDTRLGGAVLHTPSPPHQLSPRQNPATASPSRSPLAVAVGGDSSSKVVPFTLEPKGNNTYTQQRVERARQSRGGSLASIQYPTSSRLSRNVSPLKPSPKAAEGAPATPGSLVLARVNSFGGGSSKRLMASTEPSTEKEGNLRI